MSNSFYVYAYFRPWDGTICYIGKGKDSRWLWHELAGVRHYNSRFARIFAKAKRLGMTVPRQKLFENLEETEAFELECLLIRSIGRGRRSGDLVNATDGGEGTSGFSFPEAARKKLSAAVTAAMSRPDVREKLKPYWESRKTLVVSQETRRKLSETSRGRKRTLASIEKGRRKLIGRKFSAQHLENMSRAHKGKKKSPQAVAKLSSRMMGNTYRRGTKMTDETIAKMRIAQKAQWQNPEYRTKTMAARKRKTDHCST